MPRTKRPALKRRMTELFVKKVRPKSAAFVVWDELQRGLAIRVQPTGARAWKCIYSYHGRPRWLHIGDANAIGLSDARTLAAEAMLAVARGKDPQAERKAERVGGTFADLHVKYLEHAKRRNKSWQQGERLVNRYALPRWAKLQASTIARADVKSVLARIDQAPILQNQVLASISAVFSWAVREEILPANPCKLIARNETKSRERVLAESEVPKFWAAFDAAGVEGTALKMILLLGQRPGEIAHMRHEHIKDGWWEMPGEPIAGIWPGTKNASSHRVWLPKAAQHILAELGGGTGFVFASERGRPVSRLDTAMREACKKLGAQRATPHDLRRTHGSTITAMAFGRDAMNRIQNHKEGGIGSVYDRHEYADENKRIMETVAARIMALVEGAPAGNVLQMPVRGTQ